MFKLQLYASRNNAQQASAQVPTPTQLIEVREDADTQARNQWPEMQLQRRHLRDIYRSRIVVLVNFCALSADIKST